MNYAGELIILTVEFGLFMIAGAVVVFVTDNILLKHPKTRKFMLGLLGLEESDLYETTEETVKKDSFDEEIESIVNECFRCG